MTWGLVSKFRDWLLTRGYAIGSVNLHLTTLRTYAGLAMRAGVIPAGECAAIRAVRGYGRTEGKHVDSARAPTRKGAKKAQPVSLTPEQAARLKAQPDTPQGRRDALLLCLLLDHGLRVGEVAGLRVGDFDLAAGELRFYRPKVDKMQRHKLTADTLAAARAYLAAGDMTDIAPAQGPALRASRKGGALLQDAGMTARALTARGAISVRPWVWSGSAPTICGITGRRGGAQWDPAGPAAGAGGGHRRRCRCGMWKRRRSRTRGYCSGSGVARFDDLPV